MLEQKLLNKSSLLQMTLCDTITTLTESLSIILYKSGFNIPYLYQFRKKLLAWRRMSTIFLTRGFSTKTSYNARCFALVKSGVFLLFAQQKVKKRRFLLKQNITYFYFGFCFLFKCLIMPVCDIIYMVYLFVAKVVRMSLENLCFTI